MFPNALKATRKLSPRTAPLSPNTALKNNVATVVPELTRSYFVTGVFSWSALKDSARIAQQLMVNDHGALTCSEICHIGKDIEYIDNEEGQEGILSERLDGVLERERLAIVLVKRLGA